MSVDTALDKRCSRCKVTKSPAEFHRHTKHWTGLQAECKQCKHERKAMKAGDKVKVRRLRDGKVQEYLRGNNHGESRTPLYSVWKALRSRCNDTTNKWYGGRGISYSSEWEDFFSFKDWALKSGYAEGMELDRIDADMNYGPDNCRWIAKRDNIKRARAAFDPVINDLLAQEVARQGASVDTVIARIVSDYLLAQASQQRG